MAYRFSQWARSPARGIHIVIGRPGAPDLANGLVRGRFRA